MYEILAISSQEDPHITMVQAHLDTPIAVFCPSKFPNDTDITYRFHEGRFRIWSEGRDFSQVKSVWFRKPNYLKPRDLPVDAEYMEFAHKAYTLSVQAIYDLLREKFWLSDYRRLMKANNKLFQLEVAHDIGFRIPDTILTSNPRDAVTFRSKHGNIVTKSLYFYPIQVGHQLMGFYTTRIREGDEIDFSGLPLAPAILQEEIADKLDLRITVVGKQIFPCCIKLKDSATNEVDWRTGITTNELDYQVYDDIPISIREKCIRYVEKLGLAFGVVEFAIDRNGEYWFLEINPNGQWGFVELETGLEISKAVAHLLVTGN